MTLPIAKGTNVSLFYWWASIRIPSYDEVVGTDSAPSDSEDEEALEEQEIFERKYNFRFEEPDADLVRYVNSTPPSAVYVIMGAHC